MKAKKASFVFAAAAALLVVGASVSAQSGKPASMELTFTSVAAGLTAGKGSGILHLPNLGRGCRYGFTVEGAGGGIKLGISKMTAQGVVHNLDKVASFPGGYSKTDAEATFIKGKGVQKYKNQRNNVAMELKGKTQGISLGFGAEGLTIKLNRAIPSGPKKYFLFFGFNKDHLNKNSRATLENVLAAWKCRYAKISIVGHTDTVGKEDYNLDLSGKRAHQVVSYLMNAGVVFSRIGARGAGEKELLKPTGKGVRLRSNRAVVLTIID
jgi:outer membrane protein OmpA-like peptidoglycan-associated protein